MGWEYNKKHLQIAKVLVEEIRNKKTITYKDLAIEVGLSVEKNSPMYGYLGELSDFSFEHSMPLISVMVVRKEDGMPGEGFFGVYKEKRGIPVGKNKDKQMEIFIKELNDVFNYSDWDNLIKLLKKEIKSESTLTLREYINRQTKNTKLILENNKNKEVEFIEKYEHIDELLIEEGNLSEKVIEIRKRNSQVRIKKIEQFKKENDNKVFCEVCKESELLVLDVHHDKVQVCEMQEGHKTMLSDLRVICSNCHRKVHGYKITVDELIVIANK